VLFNTQEGPGAAPVLSRASTAARAPPSNANNSVATSDPVGGAQLAGPLRGARYPLLYGSYSQCRGLRSCDVLQAPMTLHAGCLKSGKAVTGRRLIAVQSFETMPGQLGRCAHHYYKCLFGSCMQSAPRHLAQCIANAADLNSKGQCLQQWHRSFIWPCTGRRTAKLRCTCTGTHECSHLSARLQGGGQQPTAAQSSSSTPA
jgi:hypothetical protein